MCRAWGVSLFWLVHPRSAPRFPHADMRNTDQGWRNRQVQFNIFGLRFAVVALAMAFQSPPCIADGALAVGLPADVAHVGFAAGHKLNDPDMDAARKGALESLIRTYGSAIVRDNRACHCSPSNLVAVRQNAAPHPPTRLLMPCAIG
jgi:hypothetical protein